MANFAFYEIPSMKEFEKLFVGFEPQFERLKELNAELIKQAASYPPVNIRKASDNQYVIEMAVAGFGTSDLEIELAGDKLTVRGNVEKQADEHPEQFLFKGIANRAFTRAFVINDTLEVKNAQLINGMLRIALDRMATPPGKARKVPIQAEEADAGAKANASAAEGGDSQEWQGYAQTFLTSVLQQLLAKNQLSAKKMLYYVQEAPHDELCALLAGTPAAAQLASRRTFACIRLVAANYLEAYAKMVDLALPSQGTPPGEPSAPKKGH